MKTITIGNSRQDFRFIWYYKSKRDPYETCVYARDFVRSYVIIREIIVTSHIVIRDRFLGSVLIAIGKDTNRVFIMDEDDPSEIALCREVVRV